MEKKLALILLDNKISAYTAVVENNREAPPAYTAFIADLVQLRDILTPKPTVYQTLDEEHQRDLLRAREVCGHCKLSFKDGDRTHILAGAGSPIPSYYHHDYCWDAMWNERLPNNNQKECQ